MKDGSKTKSQQINELAHYKTRYPSYEVSILFGGEVNETKKAFMEKFFGVLTAATVFMLLGAATNNGPRRYAVSEGGGSNTYSVCVTDTYTGETRCQQGGGPKEHSFSPIFSRKNHI
jgi:acyl-homoserine lactone acylase PvdQ